MSAAVVALASIMILWWGAPTPDSLRTARLAVRGELADAGCEFTANVLLASAWQQWAFSGVREDARRAFVTTLRYRRRYMVETPIEREGLAVELTEVINRLARAEIAERVEFARFELF